MIGLRSQPSLEADASVPVRESLSRLILEIFILTKTFLKHTNVNA